MERVPDGFYRPVYDDATIKRIQKDFSRLRDEHYLDHAGATMYSETQMQSVSNDMLSSLYANPHSAGTTGNLTHDIIERTRYRLLDHFHASSEEYSLVFTSGATAALKIVAESFCFKNGAATDGETGSFVYLQDNHTSVLGMRDSASKSGAKVSCLSHERAFGIFAEKPPTKIRRPENAGNCLFVYSAQCNFTGFKYPLEWIRKVHDGILDAMTDRAKPWYVLLDAAGFVGTNDLNLSKFKPDFVAVSFYKMFGYPTGTGALLVKKSSSRVLEKIYYGGGTVNLALSLENFHVKRDVFHERFEDGTLSFLSIISLQHGLDAMSIVSLDTISRHVFSLARYLHHSLSTFHHQNGNPVVKIYGDTNYEDRETQGGTVAFNLLRSSGEYVGYTEVVHMASIFKIHLRTGCFCNPGTCQRKLGLSNDDVMNNYEAGYTCGGSRDLIDGRPTGAVRISFGYMSRVENVDAVFSMIRKCFIDGPVMIKVPHCLKNFREALDERFRQNDNGTSGKNDISAEDDFLVINNSAKMIKTRENIVYIASNEISRNTEDNSTLKLSRLFVYPIKSCAAYEVEDSWLLGERGLEYDREWMIVTSAGICLSQKQNVRLCLLKPEISREKNLLILSYPGMPATHIPLNIESSTTINGELCRSRVCGHRVEGIDCGSEISEWLSLALGKPNLRLIRRKNIDNFDKVSKRVELTFSSQAQYLLINEASVEWINKKLPDDSDCSRKTTLHRFRGNMIVRGGIPFEETTWSQIQIGKHSFQVDGPCTRCQMVCVDQTTGKKTVEPLRLIAEEFHGKMRFGVYLSRRKAESAVISIGDPIIGR